jgi:CheY-like chemotaxis protein
MEAFVDDPAACAYIDSTQVHQVVLNLCTNAAAAIPSGDGRIVIRQQRVAVHDGEVGTVEPLPAGDYIRLTVSDNGEGMDEEMRRRIFEPFFTTRSSLGGTGLGLTMVHAIVRSHDGGVVVTSKRGLGTTIHVYLPLARTAALAPAAAVAAAPVRTAVRAGLRVLVVDDDESVGRATQRLLVRMGHVPTVFARPREALEWLRRAPAQVDAVITDLTMPGMNGAELAAAVRRLRPDLPIILSSGMLDDDIRAQAEIGGVATVLSKPYTASELAAALAASGEGEVTPAAGGGPPAVGG